MSQRTFLQRIVQLDPEQDHLEIVYLDSFHEFPFDTTRSLEVALFRTFAVPSVSALLYQTGEFNQRAQKRYDDTDLILSELIEHGYDSERGRAALRRMNRLHQRFAITNADYLYVLSTFIFEPIRWNERFGWRRMVEQERLAHYFYWREIGRRMAITAIPESYQAFEQYNLAYEREHFRYSESNQRVAEATRAMFLGWFLPKPLWGLAAPLLHSILDDPLLDAVGFPRPPAALRRVVESAMQLRARLWRLLPERRSPRLRTGPRRPTYPNGYRVDELGPVIEEEENS
jgi:hypothetical protein